MDLKSKIEASYCFIMNEQSTSSLSKNSVMKKILYKKMHAFIQFFLFAPY